MTSTKWDSLAAGVGCPFDLPRIDHNEHWDKVCSLTVSTLYLHAVQTFRGYSLPVYDGGHVTRLEQLPDEQRAAFVSDLCRAQAAVTRAVSAHHVNLELLGNAMPHLHWHIIPRFKDDPRWGQPIWMSHEDEMPRHQLTPGDRRALIVHLRHALASDCGRS